MARVWKVLVLVVGLAAVACLAQSRLSYEEIVNLALRFFNQGRRGQPIFGLLEAIPPPSSNFTSKIPLNFRIKETVCVLDRLRRPQDCAFREDGEERTCIGSFFMLRRFRVLTVDCVPDRKQEQEQEQEGSRVRRSAQSPEAATEEIDSSQLPPAVRDAYEKAKYDIISNILANF
ncbi:15 kDa protein B-like [Equus przewalskii]|uniref:15 kDa protein B-like n=1 Tax=Equus przewalskii TaxID=9798 RepID=A0ABM2EMX5_EQUPR|nr:PREDICTED: 15 kDa protein B-like [Equus przewalskii]